MSNMDVTARFRADTTDFQRKVQGMNSLYKDAAGKWRTETGQFATAAQQAEAGIRGMGSAAQQASGKFTIMKNAIGTALGAAAVGLMYKFTRGLLSMRREMIDLAIESRKTEVRIEAIAKSMGFAGGPFEGMTKRVIDHASELQNLTGVSDETIKSAQALILTFKDVGRTATEAGGIFDRTTKAALDLSAAGFGDIQGSAKSLARALQDPLKGLTMLGRQGVTFSAQEKEKIKTLVKSNDLLGAQEMILAAVEKQVGGTAEATMRESDRMKASMNDLKESMGLAMLPGVEAIQRFVTDRIIPSLMNMVEVFKTSIMPAIQDFIQNAIQRFQDFIPTLESIRDRVKELAPLILTLGGAAATAYVSFQLFNNVPIMFAKIGLAVDGLKAKIVAMNMAALANPYVLIAAAVVGAFVLMAGAFKMVYDRSEELRAAVSDFVDTIKTVAGVIAGEIMDVFKSLMGVQDDTAGTTRSLGEVFQQVVDIVGPILSKAVEIATTAFKVLGNYVRVLVKGFEIFMTVAKMIANLIRVGVVQAFKNLRAIMQTVLDRLGPLGVAFRTVGRGIATAFSNAANVVRGAMSNIGGAIEKAINFAIDAINALIRAYNKIPFVDQVSEIGKFAFSGFTIGANTAASATGAFIRETERLAEASKATTSAFKDDTDTTETNTGAKGKNAKANDDAKKALDALKKKLEEYRKSLESSTAASKALSEATEILPPQFAHLSEVVGDFVKSSIQQAFGPEGTISGVITQFKTLSKNIDEFYRPLLNAELFGKQAVKAVRQQMNAAQGFLKAATETAIRLLAQREKVRKALTDLDTEYNKSVDRINKTFDGLDKAAAETTAGLEAHWNSVIAGLEAGLARATEAFDRENSKLQNLIQERDSFLSTMASSARSFVNNLTFNLNRAAGQVGKQGNEIRRTIKEYANGLRVTFEQEVAPAMNAIGDAGMLTGADIREALQDRLAAVRDFSANIRALVARGLDPALVKDFVSAGVDGAGQAVQALVEASDSDLAAINQAQAGLAREVADFQKYASKEWFDAGIAQQEAIVAPLRAAKEAAAAALATANATRDAELAAARAHQEQLKLDREAALEAEKLLYDKRKLILEAEGQDIEDALTANADMINERLAQLQKELPPIMHTAGIDAINGLIAGLRSKEKDLMKEVRRIANAVKQALKDALRSDSPSRVTMEIGRDVASGLAIGMRKGAGDVLSAANVLGSAAIPAMGPKATAGGGVTNYSITVNTGIATDPAETGRQVVEAIRKYERMSGPVFVSAS